MQLLVPVGILVRDLHALQEVLDIVLNDLPINLHGQHQVGEDILGKLEALPRFENLF